MERTKICLNFYSSKNLYVVTPNENGQGLAPLQRIDMRDLKLQMVEGELLKMYRNMILIREFEERTA